LALLAGVTLLLGACGDDPPGPEELRLVTTDTVVLGAAVIELSGEGIVGVRGPAGVDVVYSPIDGDGEKSLPRVRVVAILDTPGTLTLTVDVARAGAPLPGATVIQASGPDDALLRPAQLPEVRVLR
jgi:hypothetical protein